MSVGRAFQAETMAGAVSEGKAIKDKIREKVGPRLCRSLEATVRNLAFALRLEVIGRF